MQNNLWLLIAVTVAVVIGFLVLAPKPTPELQITPSSYDFETVSEHREVQLTVANTGRGELIIYDISSTCECFQVSMPQKPLRLKPGEQMYLKVAFNPTEHEGSFTGALTILSNDRKRPVVQVALQARVVAQKPELPQQPQEPAEPTQPPPEVAFPTKEGIVTDVAGILAEEVKTQLAQLLQELKEQIKAEVLLLTVPSISELSLQEYAQKIMQDWKLESGRAALIVLLPEKKEATVVVGRELQEELPTEKAEEIVRRTIIAAIQADEIAKGIEEAKRELEKLLAVAPEPEQPPMPLLLIVPAAVQAQGVVEVNVIEPQDGAVVYTPTISLRGRAITKQQDQKIALVIVNINGSVRPAELRADGSFSAQIQLAGLRTMITVVAVATNAAIGSVRLNVTFRADQKLPEECKDIQIENVIVGTADDDLIEGTRQNDLIWGLGGNDIIRSGEGSDCIVGGDGDDTIEAGSGDDVILGENGSDIINSGEGEDFVYGQAGDDSITNPSGQDVIWAGTGNDTVRSDWATIYLEEGNDTAVASGTIQGGLGDDTITGGGGNDTIQGGPGNDIINGGNGNDTIDGGPGNDQIAGGWGVDTINAGDGDDVIFIWWGASRGVEVIDGGPGKDTLVLNDISKDRITPAGAPPPNKFSVADPDGTGTFDVRNVEAVK
jgi:uncharacterized membrane protein YgcG